MSEPRPLPERLPSRVRLDPEEEALLRGCLAQPWDDPAFLVYADWLEEHGHTERANFIRRQVAQAGQEEEWCEWAEAPKAVRAWARAVLPAKWQQLCFARGLPGLLRLTGDNLPTSALAGWIWGIQSPGERIGDEEAAALAACPHLAGITSLRLGFNQIRAAGTAALASSPHLACLTSLHLEVNQIGAAGAQALASSPHLARLTNLDLGFNQIRAAGAQALASSPHLARLSSLGLYQNRIDSAGAQALASSPHLTRLTGLLLGHNNIGDAGAEALASSPHLEQLTWLDLGFNDITEAGVQALATSTRLTRLSDIHLHGNRIGDAGAKALERSGWRLGSETGRFLRTLAGAGN
jgi:uncharacterized protein (TIGR02996 family)